MEKQQTSKQLPEIIDNERVKDALVMAAYAVASIVTFKVMKEVISKRVVK